MESTIKTFENQLRKSNFKPQVKSSSRATSTYRERSNYTKTGIRPTSKLNKGTRMTKKLSHESAKTMKSINNLVQL